MKIKNIHIFGGGTLAHVTNHFAISAPAYGKTARDLDKMVWGRFGETCSIFRHLTKMAGGDSLETNEDIAAKIEELKKDPNTKIIFFNCALTDWVPARLISTYDYDLTQVEWDRGFGKDTGRLSTHDGVLDVDIRLSPAPKIISNIRTGRKDIFLIGFKATCGDSKQEMYEKGLRLCKEGSCNLVLVNDTKTRHNMIVTPEESTYSETDNRLEALRELVDITWYRSQLTFTQSTVVDGQPVPWTDERVPAALRTVVDYCINKNAYKPFQGKTAGHFACRLSDTEFLTSIRKTNLNDLYKVGLVYVKTDGPDTVLAYGAKPSVGGQSQRIVFKDHPGYDCIVHFHCPLKPKGLREVQYRNIPVVSQREAECGSHQCGKNTSDHLAQFGNLKCVMLDNHGPNIIFNKNIDPMEVINFIEANFDLSQKTGGYNLI